VDLLSLKNITKLLSLIAVFIALFFLLPVLVGILYGEDVVLFALFDLLFLSLGAAVYLFLRSHTLKIRIKDAILAVNLIWILLGIVGAIPLLLYTEIGFADGFFEAISGFTTTGATIYSDIEALPHHILFFRSLMHWLGGIGIIVLGVGLFSLINPTGSMALFKAEATGNRIEKMTPRIRDTAVKIWGVYLALTLLDMMLLWLEGMSLFDAINHAFSTISTGGFSTKNNSMAFWGDNGFILWTSTVFMLLSGINFLAHLKLVNGDGSGYRMEEVRWYIGLFLLFAILLTFDHHATSEDTFWRSATHAFFTIASVMTTTGFASLDYAQWGSAAIALIFLAMLIGGNAGSTAGGFKVSRLVVLAKNIGLQTRKLLHPKAITALYLDGNRITYDVLSVIGGFAFLFVLSNIAVTGYLFARGYDVMTSISAAVATVGNIGPGFSHVGPVENYRFFGSIDKIVLAAAMILGRLEFYTVVVLFSRAFWKRF
jgi:trk system potassium uptake protein TrkH